MFQKNYPYYEHPKLKNLSEYMDYISTKYNTKVAFSYHKDGELIRKSFLDFTADVKNLSNFFYKKYRGKHIGIAGENSYNWLVTFMALILSGNVAVPIDKDADEDLLKRLIKTGDVDVLYYSENYLPFVKKIHVKSETLETISEKVEEGKNYNNEHAPKDNTPAAIFFTSGTTGANKGVVLSEKNMTADIYGASSLYMPYGATVSILPFHHSFGLVTAILMPAYYGVETYICSSLKRFVEATQLIHPDTLFLVPAFVEGFYRQIWRTARKSHKETLLKAMLGISGNLNRVGLDFRRTFARSILREFGGDLKHIICGGAYLDPTYVKWFRKLGIDVLNGYGITECSPVLSVNRNKYYRDGSIGQPCRDVEVKIIDGEICAHGDVVMLGYYEKGKITPPGKYFHTGDLGRIDKDGFIFITGRIKNTIILSNGENVSPEVIEADLLKNKGVREVVVYADGNMIKAMVYPEENRIGDKTYFETIRRRYNYNKPDSRKLAEINLRTTEFIKNNTKKIIRSKIMEENS